jgi:hypothetical protein
VIKYAVTLSGFWQWGGGGQFKKSPLSQPEAKMRKADTSNLFRLIEERTKDGKIAWAGDHQSLKGSVPGTGVEIRLSHVSDQRDGD